VDQGQRRQGRAMLTASAAARGRRLQTKAQQGRPTDKIERLLPAGGTTVEAPDRTAYAPGTAGTKRWAEDTRSATDGFALSKRQRSTAIEHVNYMSGWSRLLEKQGFGKYVEVCGAEVKNCLSDGKRGLRPVMEKATKGARKKTLKVMLPEMILAHLADMLSGKAKKNPGVAMRAAKAGEKEQPKARKGKKVVATVSAPGEFGHGAFKNEPWGLQSYEKRVYAVREFYKATLRGETADNPADDERVKGMLSSIVRVVGKKGRHVPEVRAR